MIISILYGRENLQRRRSPKFADIHGAAAISAESSCPPLNVNIHHGIGEMMTISDRLKTVAVMGAVSMLVFTMIDVFFSTDLSDLWFNNWFLWIFMPVCWFFAPYIWAWTDGQENREK